MPPHPQRTTAAPWPPSGRPGYDGHSDIPDWRPYRARHSLSHAWLDVDQLCYERLDG